MSKLGKGLGALLEESDYFDSSNTASVKEPRSTADTDTSQITGREMLVDITLLKPNPYQPRKEFTSESLDEMADSIRQHGIIQPITVEDAGDGSYFIITGERRKRGAERAGLTHVPVLLRTFSDERKLEVALIENIQRENLNPLEEAKAYQQIMQMENINQDEAAKKVGKNRSTVANALRLLKLPEDMQNAVASGTISAGHARALLSVINPADQRVLFARITGSRLNVREAESQASEMNAGGRAISAKTPAKKVSVPNKNPDIAFIEQQFLEALGTKVMIKGSIGKGSIIIDYFSRLDLDRLYSLITGTK